MKLLHSGKVRDLYTDREGELLLVASDRVSVYDVVLPTPIPEKGKILTALSLWWFDQLADVIPNHLLPATDIPAEFADRAIRCRQVEIVPVECIARGYLTGQGYTSYLEDGTIWGLELPTGLVEGDRIPDGPVFTPTTKEEPGQGHDTPMTYQQVVDLTGEELAGQLREASLELYRTAAAIAEKRGVLLADSKFEFGRTPEGELVVADEICTPDSSRYWAADGWQPGRPQRSMDKQYLRDWASTVQGWDKTAPGPEIPPDVVAEVRRRYIATYEQITGRTWPS